MADGMLLDLSAQIKGTTAVAFFNRNTIKAVVDSRESNEGATERDHKWKTKVYNSAVKWYAISNKLLAIMVGTKEHCHTLRTDVIDWAKRYKGKEILVSEAANFVERNLKKLAKKDEVYKFGLIIAGHDTIMGLQIFRVYIVEKEVKNEQIHMFASFGTGSPYANQLMVHGYNFNFSNDAAKNFAQQIVFNASFYDKNTDGNLHYFEVTEQGWDEEEEVYALETYSSFYEQYDESSTLFLVHNAKEVIPTDDLVALFRPHGDIIIGHVVDHRVTSVNKGFYFHRLMFVSKEEAEKVLTHMENSLRDDIYKKSLILSQFTYQLNWKNESLFVQKASRQLLDYIINNSTMKLDNSPKLTNFCFS